MVHIHQRKLPSGAKMFRRVKYVHIESFDMDVRVVVTQAEKKKFGIPLEVLGMAIESEGAFIISLPIKWDEGTVWHEAHHLARFINKFHGIITTAEDHEADAYLQEYIVRKIKTGIYNRK